MPLATDEQVVERVRKAVRHRRRVGALCLVLGLIGIALVVYYVHQLRAKSDALFREMAQSAHPSTQQMAQSVDTVKFDVAFGLGFTTAAGLAGAAESAMLGLLWVLVRNRKDLLLLKIWDTRPAANAIDTQHENHS